MPAMPALRAIPGISLHHSLAVLVALINLFRRRLDTSVSESRELLEGEGTMCRAGVRGFAARGPGGRGSASLGHGSPSAVLTHLGHGARRGSASEGQHGDGARFSHTQSASVNRESGLHPTVVGKAVTECRGQSCRHVFVEEEQAACVHAVTIAAQQV